MMTTAGYAPETVRLPGFVEHTSRPIQLIDILPTSRTGRGAVSYMEETTRAHAADEIAEGGAYPEAEFAFTERNMPVARSATACRSPTSSLKTFPSLAATSTTACLSAAIRVSTSSR